MSGLHVLFRVGDGEYAIGADEVLQMESYAGATPVPNAPAYLAGIVQVRGAVVPVIDLRQRFGLPDAERTLDTRIVVVQLGDRVIGLLVDMAREVALLDAEHVRPAPSMIEAQSGGLVRATGHLDGRTVMLLDLEKLLSEERVHGE